MPAENDHRPPVALEQRGVGADRRMFSPSAAKNSAPILAVLKRVLPAHGVVLEIGCGTGEHAVCFAEAMPGLVWLPSDPDPDSRASTASWIAFSGLSNLLAPLDIDVCSGPWAVEQSAGREIGRSAFALRSRSPRASAGPLRAVARGLPTPPSPPPPGAGGTCPIGEGAGGDGASGLGADLQAIALEQRAPFDAIVSINMVHIAPWAASLGLFAGAGRLLRPGGLLFLYGPFMRDGAHNAPSNAAFDQSLKERNPSWGLRDIADLERLGAASRLGLRETIAMPANNMSLVFSLGSA